MEKPNSQADPAARINPFVGPRPIETGEKIYGREHETFTLLNLLIAERIVLLHSPSGAGKTSLVQASLIPQLQTRPYQLLPVIRLNLEPLVGGQAQPQGAEAVNRYIYSLVSSLLKALPVVQRLPIEDAVQMTLPEFLERFRPGQLQVSGAPASTVSEVTCSNCGRLNKSSAKLCSSCGMPLPPSTMSEIPAQPQPVSLRPQSMLFIFDQFEEILTLDPADQPAKLVFFEQLGQLLNDRNCWALFSMREEYLPALDPYLVNIPTRFKTSFRLDLLNPSAALKAIQATAADGGVEFSIPAAEKLIENLRQVKVQQLDGSVVEKPGPSIEPVQLQVVCRRLFDGLPAGARRITEKELDVAGDVSQSLAAYYAGEVTGVASRAVGASGAGGVERRIRDWFQHQLITEQGRRSIVLKGMKESAGLDNNTIALLEQAHLVRAEERAGSTWYELSHDRLVEPIRENNAAWFLANLSLLQRQAEQWERSRRLDSLLLRGRELVQAEQWADKKTAELIPVERDFLQKCRAARAARQRLLAAALVTIIILALLAGFGFLQASRANKSLGLANHLGTVAAVSLGQSQQSGTESANQAATAVAERARADNQSHVSLARLLATQAQELLKDPALILRATLLSIESVRQLPESAGSQALANALQKMPISISRTTHNGPVSALAFSPDGKWVVSGSEDNSARVWNAASSKEISRLIFNGPVSAVAFSPDGKWVVSASEDNTARVWEAATGKEIARMIHDKPVVAIAFSPDGKWVVSGSEDKTARVWEAATGKEIARMTYDAGVTSVAFSPDGKRVVSGSKDSTARVWKAATGIEMSRMTHAGPVFAVAFSPDGEWVVSGSADFTIRVWYAATGKDIDVDHHMNHEGSVTSVAFSPDGIYVVSGSADKTARVWEAATGVEKSRMTHTKPVSAVAFSPDGNWVVSGSEDTTARVWDAKNNKEIARMTHGGGVTALAFRPDGKVVVSGSEDNTARVWEAASGMEISRMNHGTIPENIVYAVAFSPDGKWVVSGSGDTTARVWEAASGKELATMNHDKPVVAIAFSPDGKWVVSGSRDTTARVWDAATGKKIARKDHAGGVTSVAFSPDGKWVVSGSDDKTARVWEAATGNEIVHLIHAGGVTSVTFSPDGKWVVSGSEDKTARVWEAATGKEIARMTYADSVTSVAFSPDGKWVVSGSKDKTARVWEATTGIEIARMTYDEGVTSVAFSPDGKWVVSGSEDKTARVWEAATGKEIARMTYDEGVTSVAFSPDGKWVVSGSTDFTARVWDAATGKEVARKAHAGGVTSVVFSPDGNRVASGSRDKTIRVWGAATGEKIARMTQNKTTLDYVHAVSFSPDGKWMVSGSDDNTARVWDAATGEEIARMTYDGDVTSVAFSPDGKWVVSGSDDKTARVWEAATGKEIARTLHGKRVSAVDFSPDGKWVVSGSDDGTARVWDAASSKEIARMDHARGVTTVAFSPDGKWVVSGGCEQVDEDSNCIKGSVRVWEAVTGKPIALIAYGGNVTVVAFSPDGTRVVSGGCEQVDKDSICIEGTARVSEAASGKEIAHVTHDDVVTSVAFSPNGTWVVSGSSDNIARVWDATTGKDIAIMTHDTTHEDSVNSVAFSPDGKWVVTGGKDRTVRVWGAATGKEIARMTHDGLVFAVAFSPDGKWVVSGSRDNTARVWLWSLTDLIDLACARVERNLTRTEWAQYNPVNPYPTKQEDASCSQWPLEPAICQCKVEMSPNLQSRDVPFGRGR